MKRHLQHRKGSPKKIPGLDQWKIKKLNGGLDLIHDPRGLFLDMMSPSSLPITPAAQTGSGTTTNTDGSGGTDNGNSGGSGGGGTP